MRKGWIVGGEPFVGAGFIVLHDLDQRVAVDVLEYP